MRSHSHGHEAGCYPGRKTGCQISNAPLFPVIVRVTITVIENVTVKAARDSTLPNWKEVSATPSSWSIVKVDISRLTESQEVRDGSHRRPRFPQQAQLPRISQPDQAGDVLGPNGHHRRLLAAIERQVVGAGDAAFVAAHVSKDRFNDMRHHAEFVHPS
jgi:hypothetical protein